MQENSFRFRKLDKFTLIKKYGVEQDSDLNNITCLAQLWRIQFNILWDFVDLHWEGYLY